MQEDKYLIIPRSKRLSEYTKKEFYTFALPLKGYSIGYDTYFTLEEINKYSSKFTVFVIMNKLLHRSIEEFKILYSKFNDNIKFIVEDIGLVNVIDKNRLILNENHIESNYSSINYLYKLGISSIVLNNDLTIGEINEIRKKCKSKLFFFLITRNMLMYSRRKLLTNYNKHYKIESNTNRAVIDEKVSGISLEIMEDEDASTIRMRRLYSANKYIEDMEKLDYLIIDTNTMSDIELKVTLEYYSDSRLTSILNADNYFLENEIKYKVGDIK